MMQPAWNITHGGARADEGWGVAVGADGSVYFAGYDRTDPGRVTADVFLKKLMPDGTPVWSATWGSAFDDEAFVVTTSGDYVYVGGRSFTSFSLASGDLMVLKFHASNGSLAWGITADGGGGAYDEVDGLVVDGDYIYASGWATLPERDLDIIVQKYFLNGTLVWSRTWGTTAIDEANGQMAVDGGRIYIVGRVGAGFLGSGGDAVLAAFDKGTGQYLWNRTWGGSGMDDAFGMAMGSCIYSVGITTSFGPNQIFLLKYTRDGDLLWNATWGGNGSELTRSVAIGANESSIWVAGSTTSYGYGDFDVFLLQYNQSGVIGYNATWGGAALEQSHGMAYSNGSVYIAGETRSFGAGNEDAFLLRVDPAGGGQVIPPVDGGGLGGLAGGVVVLIALVAAGLALFVVLRKIKK
jgi:hypothetical protein